MQDRNEGKPISRLKLIREGLANVDISKIPHNQTVVDVSRIDFHFDGQVQQKFKLKKYDANAQDADEEKIKEKISKKIDKKFPNVPEEIRNYVKIAANQEGFSHTSAFKTIDYFHEKGMKISTNNKRLDIITNADNTLTVIEQFSIKAYNYNNETCSPANRKPIAHIITKSVITCDEGKIYHQLIGDRVFLLDEEHGTKLFNGQRYETRYGCTVAEVKDECQGLIDLKLAEIQLAKAIDTTTNEFMQAPAQKVLNNVREIDKREVSKEEISKLTALVKSTTNLVREFTHNNLREFTEKTTDIFSINKPWAKKIGYAAFGVLGIALVAASVTFAIYSAGIGPLVIAGVVMGVKTLLTASVATSALSAMYSADSFYNMWKKQSKLVEAAKELNKVATKQPR